MSRQEQPHTPETPTETSFLSRAFFLTLSAALALTATAYFVSLGWERDILQTQLNAVSNAHVSAIQGEFDRHIDMLHSIDDFFRSSTEVTHDEFQTYITGFLDTHSDIQTLAWAPRINAPSRAVFEQETQAHIFPEFHIYQYEGDRQTPAATRNGFFPLYFAGPQHEKQLTGFDLASHPDIAPLLEKARDSGLTLTSPQLKIRYGDEERLVAVFVYPRYGINTKLDSVQARREALLGFIVCFHDIHDLIKESLRHVIGTGLDFWLFDGSAPEAKNLIHFHPSRTRTNTSGFSEDFRPTLESDLHLIQTISAPSRQWLLLFSPTEAFFANHNPWRSRSLLVVGCLLSLLSAFYVNTLTKRRQVIAVRARELAHAQHVSDERFRQLADHIDSVFWIAAPRLAQFFYISPAYKNIFGYDPQALQENPALWLEHVHPDDLERIKAALARKSIPKGAYEIEYRIRRADGQIRWIHTKAFVISEEHAPSPRIAGVDVDITERKHAEQALLKTKDAQVFKLSTALEQTADSVMVTDRMGVIEYVNPAFLAITGYHRDEVIGKTPRILKSTHHSDDFYKNMWATIQKGKVFRDVFVNTRKDGSEFYEEKTISPLKDEQGNITHFVSTGKDITERMRSEEQLHFLAYHDALTNLPNRSLLFERIEHALTRLGRNTEARLAVLFIDLDHFKNINDTLGHDMGDLLLRAIPERLMVLLRNSDTIARLGGDEFAILCEDIHSSDEVALIADKLINAIGRPFHIKQQELCIGASIGISIAPEDGSDAQTLIKHADTAMYRAKEEGRNHYQFYSHDMSAKAHERLLLESNLRHALEQHEFHLVYQPQYDIQDGRLIGAEALLRWQNEDIGPVTPDRFIPILEETGMIIAIGSWVLQSACAQAAEWKKRLNQSLKIAVNLSVRQFYDPDLHATIADIMQSTGISPDMLELEITESVLMLNVKAARDNLRAIKAMGVSLAIDDFGTGYSSLGYIKRFPVDVLKIDRGFINDVLNNPEDTEIVKAIIAMAHNLNLRVVAEGVEQAQQLDFLQSAACDMCQGFFLGRPATAEAFQQQFLQPLPKALD